MTVKFFKNLSVRKGYLSSGRRAARECSTYRFRSHVTGLITGGKQIQGASKAVKRILVSQTRILVASGLATSDAGPFMRTEREVCPLHPAVRDLSKLRAVGRPQTTGHQAIDS